jgi:hypothetical protein
MDSNSGRSFTGIRWTDRLWQNNPIYLPPRAQRSRRIESENILLSQSLLDFSAISVMLTSQFFLF